MFRLMMPGDGFGGDMSGAPVALVEGGAGAGVAGEAVVVEPVLRCLGRVR